MEELGREDEFSEEPSKGKKTLKTLASPLAWTCKRNCCFRNTIHSTHTVTSLRSTVFKGEQRFLRWLTSLNRSIREKQKKKFWNQLAWHSIDPPPPILIYLCRQRHPQRLTQVGFNFDLGLHSVEVAAFKRPTPVAKVRSCLQFCFETPCSETRISRASCPFFTA